MFYVEPLDDSILNFPCFVLEYNNWDDYSSKTSFRLYYKTSKTEKKSIGRVKIMHKTVPNTIEIIPKEFKNLDDEEYCSLGQDLNYFENLKALAVNYEDILEALNDAAFMPVIRERFEKHSTFINSLLRNSEAEKSLNEAKNIIEGIPFDTAFQFEYSCLLQNADKKHIVNFNFGDNDQIPSRIIGLVGKNGTGKTQFLAKLAYDLSGKSHSKNFKESFSPHRPFFSKVIAVSFSAFDKFKKPEAGKSFSYKYCGIMDEHGRVLSTKKTIENIKLSIDKINELRRRRNWTAAFNVILGTTTTDSLYEYFFEDSDEDLEEILTALSSGQRYLLYVISDLIANIKRDSLILFDEPEIHLHPNAIANFVRVIHKLLDTFESYAVLATHSPLIIQELPSKYVIIFDRSGNTPLIRKLNIESFGENIDTLSEEVFQTKDVTGTYKEVLDRLSDRMSYKEVNKLFDNKLGLSAKSYLLGLYPN